MSTKTKARRNSEEAQVGIGTMIVFIATVLVAAVAAGVLIDTSGKLQERSSRTGGEATEQVASNLRVESVIGQRDAGQDLKWMNLTVSLAAGAKEVDLNELKIRLQNKTSVVTLGYSADGASATAFGATEIRDVDGSWTNTTPAMTSGDLIQLDIDLSQIPGDFDFGERDEVVVTLLPEVGASVTVGFKTPASYGIRTVVSLL